MTKEKMIEIRTIFKDMIKKKKIYNATYIKELIENYVKYKTKVDSFGEKLLEESDMQNISALENTERRIETVIKNYKNEEKL